MTKWSGGNQPPVIAVEWRESAFLPTLGVWLDSKKPRSLSFVSHAHSDHTAHHARSILTPATARLMEARLGAPRGLLEVQEFGEVRSYPEGFSATLLPAGHVPGSAQLYLEAEEGSLLYSGDFQLRENPCAGRAGLRRADTLIMETTFGIPKYQFPPASEVIEAILNFCRKTLDNGGTPVLLAYSLGKAQEILCAMNGSGFRIYVHGAIAKMNGICETLGIRFPVYEKLEGGIHEPGVVLCPPSARSPRFLAGLKNPRLAMLSGWAMDASAIYRYKADAAFPLSDHAGYDDLLLYVEKVAPSRVFTLHGYAQEFARDLRSRGIEAWALKGPNQMDLPFG